MKPVFFPSQNDFRKGLKKNHKKEKELLAGFYKVGSGKPSMTWSQSVDQALCFGWIDGIRRSLDSESYTIRFTPRRSTSIWSAVNIKKVEELTSKGLMQPAGIKAFKRKKDHRSKIYAYESEAKIFSSAYEKKFEKNKKAWYFFIAQAPSYKKVMIHWVMSAKQEVTQQRRLEKLISGSADKKRLI